MRSLFVPAAGKVGDDLVEGRAPSADGMLVMRDVMVAKGVVEPESPLAAIAKIQARAHGAEHGQLALSEGQAGDLALEERYKVKLLAIRRGSHDAAEILEAAPAPLLHRITHVEGLDLERHGLDALMARYFGRCRIGGQRDDPQL